MREAGKLREAELRKQVQSLPASVLGSPGQHLHLFLDLLFVPLVVLTYTSAVPDIS